ncbi:MAG: S8 family serine peptidase, partial [Streptosporangiaceae bacterium]
MSHRLPRGIVMPFTAGLAAAVAALGVLGPLPALGATTTASVAGAPVRSQNVRSQEWWLADLHVTQAWQTSVGAGITVAVLGTGVDLGAVDLAGDVTTGPDFTDSGRAPGSPFWGFEGTAVAAIIAGHGHGAGDRSGIVGIAPAARILSVRVTLEFNDPLSSDASITRRLPQAIANGITYAVAHGARIIDLPLDPGTLGLTGQEDPAAAGGSPAERQAVDYALGKGVVLVAPAGDDGMGPGIVNYPAAYPGVIAVGAVTRGGRLAPFSSRRSYVSLTAPGVGLEAPDLADGYQMTSSTSAASGMVAGVAALIMSRFPHLSAAQVTQALTESTAAVTGATGLPPLPARSPSGAGYGTVNAARAIQVAALITAASQPPPVRPVHPVHPVRPRQPARRPVAAPGKPAASTLAGSVLRAALAGVCVLIVLLVVMLLVMRSRRERGRAPVARADRTHVRARGLHEQRRPDHVPAPPVTDQRNGARSLPQATR